jgi:hypothetical protein
MGLGENGVIYGIIIVYLLIQLSVGIFMLNAQLVVDPQIRTRTEYRQGYMNLHGTAVNPAFFTEQRSRIAIGYQGQGLTLWIAPQDVRLWGNTQTTTARAESTLSLFEAWAEVQLSNDSTGFGKLALKVGRQELNYDDERILGGLDWAAQGRRHDVALLKWNRYRHQLHVGLAFNQTQPPPLVNTLYISPALDDYKSMQMAHYRFQTKPVQLSLVGIQEWFQDTVGRNKHYYRTTTGLYSRWNLQKWLKVDLSGFYQFGNELRTRRNLSAGMIALLVNTRLSKGWDVSLGYDFLSGNDVNNATDATPSGNSHYFNPVFGTNHKFYGFMDYFYVGVGHNRSGLQDLYGRIRYTFSPKLNAFVDVHRFAATGNVSGRPLTSGVSNILNSYTGTEADFIVNYLPLPYCKLQFGYSFLVPTETMAWVKKPNANAPVSNAYTRVQQWAYLMVTFQPAKPVKIKAQV